MDIIQEIIFPSIHFFHGRIHSGIYGKIKKNFESKNMNYKFSNWLH